MKGKIKELYKFLSGHPDILLHEDEPMSKHTTFKIGGPAELLCELKTNNVVVKALNKARELGIKPFVMGNGSNLLVDDCGIPGVVFKITGASWYVKENTILVDAGTPLIKVATVAKRMGLTGLEFAYGIPGTLGGAVYMNAGAYDGEMSHIVESVTYADEQGLIKKINGGDCEFGYRTSFFKKNPGLVILSANLKLEYGEVADIDAKMSDFMNRRKEKQPLEFPSAGSVFKRPEGHFAGALIEKCGLKGYSIGGAQVSRKHAGFIVNKGNATCDDVLKLIAHIQKTVLDECGVEMECEVLYAPNNK